LDKLPDFGAAPGKAAASAPAAPPAGYAHTRSYVLNGRVLTWVAPVSLLLVFVLALPFFSWVGMYPARESALTQSGFGVAFNSYDIMEVWKANYKTLLDPITKDGPGVGLPTIFFILLLIPTLLVALAGAMIHLKLVPVQLPPSVEPFLGYRPLLIVGLAGLCLLLLILQMAVDLPLENKVHDAAAALAKEDDPVKDLDTPEKRLNHKLLEGKIEGGYNVQRTSWLSLTVVLLVVAVLAGLLEFLTLRRGNAPPIRVDFLS
jgi:hypothetical protein